MRKYLIAICSSVLLLGACKKDNDTLFDQSADERLSAVLTAFQDKLVNSTDGWKAIVNPGTAGSYSFYMKFTNQNRVTMMSDFNDSTASVYRESSYRVKGLQQPSIIFDTYNYLHILMDPTPSVSGGTAGKGLVSDIEYYLPTAINQALLGKQPDTITSLALKGRFNGSDIIFTKASSAEAASYTAGNLKKLRVAVNGYTQTNKYLFVDFGDGIKIQATINATAKTITFQWLKDGNVFSFTTGFSFALDGLLLRLPFTYNNSTITKILWDNTKLSGTGTGSGTPVNFQIAPAPILPLYLFIGTSITGVLLPQAITFPGWSDDFKARRANAAAAMLAGAYKLTMGQMDHVFTATAMTMNVDIFQGATRFIATFPYAYSKTPAGVFKFTAGATSGNAGLIIGNMAPLLAQRMDVDNFTVDYFTDATEGVLAKFTSVQHPDFIFTGRMR
ncbi:MAG: DUF4302 domain-containing protein [Chitinophagaceae bacterium]